MDIVRERRRPFRGRYATVGLVVLAVVVAGSLIALMRPQANALSVDRSSIVTASVRRGVFERSVTATGTLSSKNVRVVTATQPGIVTAILVKPGAYVRAGAPLVRLENPSLEAAVVNARAAVESARAQLTSAREQARAAALTQESNLAGQEAQLQEDSTTASSLQSLHHDGLVADSTYRIATIKASQQARQVQIARAQVAVGTAQQDSQIVAARAQVDQAMVNLATQEENLAALTVQAGGSGVVQSMNVRIGSNVEGGKELATIADQQNLKAVLQVPESEAHAVNLGMPASVDTGNGTAVGTVSHISPVAQEHTVAVDISFPHPLPAGSRPDLGVTGTIQIQRLPDALSVQRPAGVNDNSETSLYVLDSRGDTAKRVRVRLGAGSTERIQILGGLTTGQTVIISDTSAFGDATELRIH